MMSKNNNVNPGQYKVAGRERPGENLGQERAKQELVKNREEQRHTRRESKRHEMVSRAGRSTASQRSS
jgi:hypothetical protein